MTPLAAGDRFGRYQILSKLGAGGMGEVFLAEDTQLGRRVALKFLSADMAGHATAQKRLVREARAAASLDHPHICSVYEVGEDAGRFFIAMQFVEGDTLDARLRRSTPTVGETLGIAVQVVDALSEAHARGILHRDIKPANIMITPRGHAKVMDFGLAKVGPEVDGADEAATASLLTMPGTVLGTAPYMSPEQVRGEPADARSDLFSVGVLLYEMLSGQRPFQGKTTAMIASAVLTHEPTPLSQLAPATPPELERIVSKALRKDPGARYQTAKDLLVDLRTLKDEHPSAASASASGPMTAPVPPRARGTPRAWSVGAAIVAVIVFGGWFGWRAAKVRSARAQLPQIAALADTQRLFEAYDLAIAIEGDLRDDAELARLMPTLSDTISVTTDPPGAQAYLQRFAPDATAPPARQSIGTTPVANHRIARGEYVLTI